MKLGSSIRRRRVKKRQVSLRGWRGVLTGSLLLLSGLGSGYIFSTKVWFPVPEPEQNVLEMTNIRDLDYREAIERVDGLGLHGLVADSFRHPTAIYGRVLGQNPLPGQLYSVGDTVEMTVSLGPIRRSVPDVTRLHLEAALPVLESSGFATVIDSLDADLPLGQVVELIPEPGTLVDLPMEVRVAISKGPSLISMPFLRGLEQERGEEIIDSLGLVVDEITSIFRFGRDQGRIVEQRPMADSLIEPGSGVSIVVGRRSGGSRK